MGDERDILIELRSDMRHVRETMDHIKSSDGKQWEKIDEHGSSISGHERSIGSLTWGFRLIAGGILTAFVSSLIYAITRL